MHFISHGTSWGHTPSPSIQVQTPVENNIQEALIERAVAYGFAQGSVYNQPPAHAVMALATPEIAVVQQLCQAKQVAVRLIRSKMEQFSFIRNNAGAQLQPSNLGWDVLQLLSMPIITVRQEYPCHVLDPRIELFFECAEKRNLLPLWPHPSIPMEESRLLLLVDSLNGFTRDVRKLGTAASFKSKVKRFQDEIQQRHKGMQQYFKRLCELYPDGHIIRMDFCYVANQPVGYAFGSEMHEIVTLDGQALIEHLTKSLGSAVAGYAWKRDFGASRGYQYHLVAILNGPQIQELYGIEQSLGEYWVQTITGGKGLWVDCSGLGGGSFRYRGLNACNQYVGAMEDHLSQTSVFMTLTDSVAGFAPPGTKPYGMGTLPPRSKKRSSAEGAQSSGIKAEVSSGGWPFSPAIIPV